jgi:gliding motility-associated-like protein
LTISRKIVAGLFFLFAACFINQPLYAQLQFVENKGQWDNQVNYRTDFSTGSFYLEKTGFTVLMYNGTDLQNFQDSRHGATALQNNTHTSKLQPDKLQERAAPTNTEAFTLHSHVYKVNFLGGNENPQIAPDKVLPTYNNYFIGSDETKWQGNCKIYHAVTYKNVYPNIDVRYYTNAGNLKYDFIIRPGGNVNDIEMKYDGIDTLNVINKELVIGTSVGQVKELYPYTYQVQNGERQILDCKYFLQGNVVKFKIKDYLPNSTIVIDPTLVFCSFTGSTADNWGYSATPGPDGSLFAAGIVFNSGYPVSTGAFQQNFSGGAGDDEFGPYDIGIIRLSPNGTNRMYATYLGGDNSEQPHSMICDAQGNLVVAGRTLSSDFPTKNAQTGSTNYIPGQGEHAGKAAGGYDIFIAKFTTDGTNLIGSVQIGGSGDDGVNIRPKYIGAYGSESIRRNYGDDARSEVILDAHNNIYLASCTRSTSSGIGSFPIVNSSIQSTFGGGNQDGVILKFSPDLSVLDFSTLFGGNGDDACFVLSISPTTGNLYVGGATTSTSGLPGSKTNVINSVNQGGVCDGFVTELYPDGSGIIKTTYIGTSGDDLVYGIQFDKYGSPYIMGTTTSNSWPIIGAKYSNPGGKQFICKLQPDLSSFVYSTVFGTNIPEPNLSPVAFLVDRCQNVYVSGWGGALNNGDSYRSSNNPGTSGLVVTPNAIQPSTDGSDFYFFVLKRDADSLLYATFFGQSGGFPDHVDGGTSHFDANGVIYQAMCANCYLDNSPRGTFPTTPGAWAGQNRSVDCNEAGVKIEMNFTGVEAAIRTEINGVPNDTVGCVPLTVSFSDTLLYKAKDYVWNFGDGNPDIHIVSSTTSYTFNKVGTYRVRLIAIDSSTCNIADTAYIDIKAGNNVVSPDFTSLKIGGCHSLTFQFTNTTTAVNPAYTSSSFLWDYGDGSPQEITGYAGPTHTFPSAGTYKVSLIAIDTIFCNYPDTIQKPLSIQTNVKAAFTTPARGCAPYAALIQNTSSGGTDFQWDFGDGQTLSSVNPEITHIYPDTGIYTIRLIATDTSTCNRIDTSYFTISVVSKPTSGFTFSPIPAQQNTPTQFANTSFGASTYVWNFGDGDTSTLADPSYQFNSTDTFHVCLTAINDVGCADTFCLYVPAIVLPLLDVPTAFTPGRFGENSIIKVVGFGIGSMDWKIYNRWGQMVFESANKNSGWDGTFKGALQPTDTYTYTLDIDFTNGKKYRKTGDISLLR